MRRLLAIVLCLVGTISAHAADQLILTQPLPSGAAMPAGFPFSSSPPLFADTSPSLQSLATPFGISLWIQTGVPPLFNNLTFFMDNFGPVKTAGSVGFGFRFLNTQSLGFDLEMGVKPAQNNPGAGYQPGCGRPSFSCVRENLITDGNWHHVCHTYDSTAGMSTYVDGVLRDNNPQAVGGFTVGTNYWQLGTQNTAASLRDVRVYNIPVLNPQSCRQIYLMGRLNNQIPNSGILNTGMVAHWTLSAASCTASGPSIACADSSGNGNTMSTDQAPPVMAITAPAPSPPNYSGTISFTGTCSDAIACSTVHWLVDGLDVSGAVASPFSYAWDSSTFSDGPHVITMQGFNVANAVGTTTVNISTNNGNTNQAYYFDPLGGSDSNDCKTTATACKTLDKATCSIIYHGGDSINLKAGALFVLNSGPSCYAPGNVGMLLVGAPSSLLSFTVSGGSYNSASGVITLTTGQPVKFPVGTNMTITALGGSGNVINLKGTWPLLSAGSTSTFQGPVGQGVITITSGTVGSVQNYFPGGSAARLAITTYGGGICNVFGTTTGCATIVLDSASPIVHGILLNDWAFGTLSNVIVIGGTAASIPPAGSASQPAGIFLRKSTPHNLAGGVVTNVKVSDFNIGIRNQDFTGFDSGTTISNSVVTAASPTADANVGILIHGGGSDTHVTGNYVSNMGCTSGHSTECVGGGILYSDQARDGIDEFNVTTAIGANNTGCGGPAGNWVFNAFNVTLQFNESFGLGTNPPKGCDNDNFDIDASSVGVLLQYNYAHDSQGQAFTLFTLNEKNQIWTDNVLRYNITEHDALSCGDGQGGVVGGGAGGFGRVFIYNNTIWANGNQTASPFGGCSVHQSALSFTNCPAQTSYVANNIFAINSWAGVAGFYGSFSHVNCPTIVYRNNDWFMITPGQPTWANFGGVTYITYASWAAASGETGGLTVDPQLVSPGTHPTCYSSGIPTGPQPCDAGMKLQVGSPMLGAGIDLNAEFGIDIGTRDYFGNACPGLMGGSGINIGADACGNP